MYFLCAGGWEGEREGKEGILVHPKLLLQSGVELVQSWGCPVQGREKELFLVIQTLSMHVMVSSLIGSLQFFLGLTLGFKFLNCIKNK